MSILMFSLLVFSQLPEWFFDKEDVISVWVPNSYISNIRVSDGKLSGFTSGYDPYLLCEKLDLEATPYQYLKVKLRVDKGGVGQLFWSGTDEGPYGGLSQEKSTFFNVKDTNEWQEICIFPFWHKEGKIKKIRLDLYEGVNFEIEKISIKSWSKESPFNNVWDWIFPEGDISSWKIEENSNYFFSPPLELELGKRTFISIEYSSDGCVPPITFLWSSKEISGLRSISVPFNKCDGKRHYITLDMSSENNWIGTLVAMGFILPDSQKMKIFKISLGEEPLGQPELSVNYLGPENAINRVNRPFGIMARFSNIGGGEKEIRDVRLEVSEGIDIVEGPMPEPPYIVEYGEYTSVKWIIKSDKDGKHLLKVQAFSKEDLLAENTAEITVLPEIQKVEVDYVPEPKPIETKVDLCAFYFPGWDTAEKWDCIRTVSPVRKPALGFYNEGNPECVDWQIKWAVENGIKCFLVDWYWVAGRQSLKHWFEAYKKAKYRDYLKVAIMWANHNPPKTHSPEDWEKVNLEWLDNYFNLPSYYKLGNKPLVCIWSPENLRNDLGGSDSVKVLLTRSQELAKEKGFDGIVFMAVNNNRTPSELKTLVEEGYACFTNYHEFEKALQKSSVSNYARYEDVVQTAYSSWVEKRNLCEGIIYYPLVETGWDSRPWHGTRALVISGRTPELFREILLKARHYTEENHNNIVVLGPLNEWGEGSYIEPNVEFGFSMYEAIRDVFAKSNTEPLPVNIAPEDVGLGPYDFPIEPIRTFWDFQDSTSGWKVLSGIDDLKVVDGSLMGKTLTENSSIYFFFYDTEGILAFKYPRATIRLRVDNVSEGVSQVKLYWAFKMMNFDEANSITIPVRADGNYYIYTFDLRTHPRWLGRVKSIKIVPTVHNSAVFWIDSFSLHTN
ncbi:MAG: glycoside hydrolase family 99-like domain-containing protein [Candidatus Hydrogenedentes bacterium]|nr:glycoside hydrolase family 99-like domain-containing protein [Candidatus Hydrogenedentota bacterium]